jgi:hypothetical protein
MNTRYARLAACTLLVALAGCGGDRAAMDFGGRDLGPDLFAITSTDDRVRMVLTDDYLYLSLTEQAAEDIRRQVAEEAEAKGRAGLVDRFVERTVSAATGFRAAYPLADVEDVRWEDGEMRIVFTRGRWDVNEAFRMDDEPVTRMFDEASVLELGEELRALKRERAGGQPRSGS